MVSTQVSQGDSTTSTSESGMSTVRRLASMEVPAALALLNTTAAGLSGADASERLIAVGQNALRVHRARPWRVLGRQLKSPILILLFVTAGVSVFLRGDEFDHYRGDSCCQHRAGLRE